MLETSGSSSASSWVESFVRQSLSFHSSSVMQHQYREGDAQFWGKKIKWDSFWKEWDNSRSLFNCSLVRALIISSAKWETLKTDKSTTNYVLCLVSRSWTYWLSLLSAFFTWISAFEFSFLFFLQWKWIWWSPVNSQALQNWISHYLQLRQQAADRLFCLCCAAVVVMWLSLLAKAGPLFQLRVEATDLAMYCSFS